MLQLGILMLACIFVSMVALWVVTLYKLLPLYRSGAIAGPYRAAFGVVLLLLSWVTMQVLVWLLAHNDAGAMLLNVLWAIAGLSWLALAAVRRARAAGPRVGPMLAETDAATAPPPAPRRVAAPAKTDPLAGYTVRTAPATAHGNVRSARVRKIMSMEGYGD